MQPTVQLVPKVTKKQLQAREMAATSALVRVVIKGGEPQTRSENVLYIFLFRYIFMDKGQDLRYPCGMELQVSPSPSSVLKYIISKLRVDSERPAEVSNFVHSYCIYF